MPPLTCRLNLFLNPPYNRMMKLFPSLLKFIASLSVSLLSEAQGAEKTGGECIALKIQTHRVNKRLTRLVHLKRRNEGLFDKYKNNFNAKIKISSNLFIIQTKSESLLLRKKFLQKKHNKLQCQGAPS